MRADHGTENCSVAKMHIAFRLNHQDSLAAARSFIYGPSTANIVSHYMHALNMAFLIALLYTAVENGSMVVTAAKIQDWLVD